MSHTDIIKTIVEFAAIVLAIVGMIYEKKLSLLRMLLSRRSRLIAAAAVSAGRESLPPRGSSAAFRAEPPRICPMTSSPRLPL